MSAQRDLYERVADANARDVIRMYSTSFGLASSLLRGQVRQDVANIYGLVRLADEVVDGVADAYGLDTEAIAAALDALEVETERALQSGYSTNLIVHAFVGTARRVQFGTDLTRPFFSSMRTDLSRTEHTPESFADYVYGSAEVVGLMCFRTFVAEEHFDASQDAQFVAGARALGSAFQKVNFLRDLAADVDGLGRHYFPEVDFEQFDDASKMRLVAEIDTELSQAADMIRLLPASSRRAVALTHGLFAELNRRIARTPAAELKSHRISVPTAVKARLYLQARWGMLG